VRVSVAAAKTPYKFLDYYKRDDRNLFFGRDRETRTLLADVLVSRLVVLFARTGTGKTSLINAGVRPQLEELGYRTYFVRVSKDPTRSIRDVLEGYPELRPLPRRSLADQLGWVARKVGKPIVLFLDQFEEFFIYQLEHSPAAADKFMSEVAKARENKKVHLVFSMREEFFADMDVFRDRIPTIFHNDSNVRLRWFEPEQARAAIVGPAAEAGFEMEPELANRLVRDLAEDGRVEPAQLQIVCHTLWAKSGGRPALRRYREIGGGDGVANIARRILDLRLEEEFSSLETKEQFELLEELLPLLRSRRGTKYLTDVEQLERELGKPRELILAVLRKLATSGLVRIYGRENDLVELTHDYLVERLDDLRARAGVIWPKRVLATAIARHAELKEFTTPTDDLEEVLERACDEFDERERKRRRSRRRDGGPEAFESPSDLRLTRDDAEFLFRFALHRGLHPRRMFDAAAEHGVPVWEVLAETIDHGQLTEASSALDLLAELGSERSLELLQKAWKRDDLDARAVEVLGRINSPRAIELLREALGEARLARSAQEALTGLARSRQPTLAKRAASVLVAHLQDELADEDRAPSAVDDLGRIEEEASIKVLRRVLERVELADEARDALLRLCRSPKTSVAAQATDALVAHWERALRTGPVPPPTLQLFARVHDTRVVALLEEALGEEPLAPEATRALERLTTSVSTPVAEAAQKALTEFEIRRSVALSRPMPVPKRLVIPDKKRRGPAAAPEALEHHYGLVVKALLEGRVIPFVGAGVNASARPPDVRWTPGAPYPPLGVELAEHLALRYEYPPDAGLDLLRIAQYVAVMAGPAAVYGELRDIFSVDFIPAHAHRFLASLPARLRDRGEVGPLLVTTNYDDLLERTLQDQGESFDVVTYLADGPHHGKFLHQPSDGEPIVIDTGQAYTEISLERRPVVLKLHGGIDKSGRGWDSFVATEDDYLDYMTRADVSSLLPIELVAKLRRSHFLFLGHGLRDWSLRVILNRLWGERQSSYRSWAVQWRPDELDRQAWDLRGVEVLDAELGEYLGGLEARLADVPREGVAP
jgi:hypothetical protein